MLSLFVPLMVLGPIIWYPFSKTIWVAVNRAFLSLDGQALDDRPHLSAALARAQVDAAGEDAVVDRPGRVGDDGEVEEVGLRRLDEPLTIRTGDRRQRPVLHRLGAFAEPGEHRVDIELSSAHRADATPRQRRRAPGRGR